MITRIHVNQAKIKENKKKSLDNPVLTIKTYKSNLYAKEIVIHGPSKLVYKPENPLSCGARVWIETEAKVEIIR